MEFEEIIARNNPSQSHWELNQLLTFLKGRTIKNVLEIGVHRGGSLGVWRDVFKPDLLIGIDGELLEETKKLFPHDYLVQGMSQDPKIVLMVKAILDTDKLDFIFIDGSHLYEDVKKDFEIYSPLLKEGGVIGFHDVVLRNNETCEVFRFWDEFRKDHKTITIWDGTPAGTGEGIVLL